MITVKELTKVYRKYDAAEGLLGLARNFVLRRHENVTAVDHASFTIEPGTCVGLLGANGAGKTTLVKMLTGLLVPSSGTASITLSGALSGRSFTPWHRDSEYLRQIGVVMGQRQQLWIDVSALENLRLNQVVYGLSEADFQSRLKSLSRMLGVEKLLTTQVRKLSLGEKMKMELLAAFLHRPRLLFLDEPTIGLDVVAQARIREFIRARVVEDGVTVLLTSHYVRDLEELCPRVLLIRSGKLEHDGPLKALAGRLGGVKRVTWTGGGPIEALSLAGHAPKDGELGRRYVEVAPKEVPGVVRALLDEAGVEDLSVETPPLEDSIREALQ